MSNGFHLEPEITMIRGIEAHTLDARIQVDKNENPEHVCEWDQYHKFFQKVKHMHGLTLSTA